MAENSNVLVPADHSISKGYTRSLYAPIGGQQGAMSDPVMWMSSAAYVRQKMIAVLIAAPGHMQYMDDGMDRIKMLKALVEVMATQISGLTKKLEVEYAESKVSNAGEVHETMVKVSRVRSVPVFVWPEKRGKTIFNFFQDWIIELLADPETMHPGLVNKAAYRGAGSPEFLPDAVAMTVLFIEPDNNLKTVTSAWLVTNMQPKTSGEDEGKRMIGEANEVVEQSIEFTSTTQIGDEVTALAQRYLDELNLDNMRPAALAAAYTEVTADVNSGSEDYKLKLDQVGQAAA